MVAVIIPVVLIEAVVDRPTAVTPVKLAPLIAGNAPVNCADGKEVKFAPEPLNPVAVMIPVTSRPPA